jgi:hypothetical protein
VFGQGLVGFRLVNRRVRSAVDASGEFVLLKNLANCIAVGDV